MGHGGISYHSHYHIHIQGVSKKGNRTLKTFFDAFIVIYLLLFFSQSERLLLGFSFGL